ncbi:MAG: hypothetical protein WC612_02160 [Bdellovibrionales bacterium]
MKEKPVQEEFQENKKSFVGCHWGKGALAVLNAAAFAILSPYAAGIVAVTSAASWLAYAVTKNKMTAQPEGASPQGVFRKAFNGVVISGTVGTVALVAAATSFHGMTALYHEKETPVTSHDIAEAQAILNGRAAIGDVGFIRSDGDASIKIGEVYSPVKKDGSGCSVSVLEKDFITGKPSEVTIDIPTDRSKPIKRTSKTLNL